MARPSCRPCEKTAVNEINAQVGLSALDRRVDIVSLFQRELKWAIPIARPRQWVDSLPTLPAVVSRRPTLGSGSRRR